MRRAYKQLTLAAALCLGLATTGLAFADQDTDATTQQTTQTNTPGQESAGQYVDNSALTMKVKAKMIADSTVKALNISVISYKGVVLLCGFVDNRQQIHKAIEIAKSTEGVKEVRACLYVKH